MRADLWPDDTIEAHRASAERFFAGDHREPAEVLLAFGPDGAAAGLAELSIRNIVDGCATGRVGYLEGWYVVPHLRRRGIGAALVAEAENWARRQGCTEFGSDSNVDNGASLAAHRALGFQESSRACNFRKDL